MWRVRRSAVAGAATAVMFAVTAASASAQNLGAENPVFINDSPAAADSIIQIEQHLALGNLDQAARQVQRLLDEFPDALAPRREDPAVYWSVRSVVHALLRRDADLLERYRRMHGIAGDVALAEGRVAEVERSRLMTPAGLRAAIVLAGREMEAARFDAALALLEQLDGHPDATEAGAPGRVEGARVARALARYLPRARALADRWGDGAAIDAEPGPRLTPGWTPISALPPGDLKGLVAQPLATAGFASPDLAETMRAAGMIGEDESPFMRELRCMPALMGDTIYIASTRAVAAFDRYTLTKRWTVRLPELLGPDPPRAPEDRVYRRRTTFNPGDDVRAVTAGRSLVLVAASSEPSVPADTRQAIVGIEPGSGRVRWVTPLGQINPDLENAHIRGPIMLEPGGSRAYVVIRKDAPEKRLRALYLAAVETSEGRPVWSVLVGSVGITPYQTQGSLGDAAVLHEGVLYVTDRIGLACAYEASGGRPVWARRLTGETFDNQLALAAWQVSFPIIDGERLLAPAPDRRSLLILDRSTGRLLGQPPAPRNDAPMGPVFAYVVRAGEWLAWVSNSAVALAPVSNPGAPATVVSFEGAGVRGRVTAIGDRLLVPMERAIGIISTAGGIVKSTQALDESGNAIFADEQLIVADDSRLHSYLSWEAADRVLSARIASEPTDAAAGIALAELAYRSGHDERIIAGVDAARAALERLETGGPGEQHRSHLVSSLRLMIDAAQGNAPPAGPAAARAPVEARMLGELIARLESVSRSAPERAAVLLIRGKHDDDRGSAREAAANYQAVLDSPELGSVIWQGTRLGVRAEAEAARRLEDLIARRGREAYRAHDAAAQAAAAQLPDDAPAEAIERLARRYPVALIAPTLWTRVADAHERDRRDRSAARALELGLQAAKRIPDVPRAVVGELAGRLVTNLLERGLAIGADDALRRTRRAFGDLPLTRRGEPVNTEGLLARIAAERMEFRRWPSVGMPTAGHIQTLPGWTLMEPVVRDPYPSTVTCLALRHADGRVALFARSGHDDALSEAWSLRTEDATVQLLRLERGSAIFYRATREGGSLMRVDASSGRAAWSTEPFSTHFDPGAGPPPAPPPGRGLPGRQLVMPERIDTPLEGYRPANEVIFCSDERTLAMVERSGRALAFDGDSGQRLWAAALPMNAVYDSSLHGNLLAVAGDASGGAAPVAPGPGLPIGRLRPSQIMLLDARTGDLLHTVPLEGAARWIRFTGSGELIVGLTGAVVSINTDSGAVTWTNSQPQCGSTIAAWTIDDNIIIQAENRQAWLLTGAGLLRNSPVDTRDRLETVAVPRAIFSQSGDLALSTPIGLALISPGGTLLGVDAVGGGPTMLPPVPVRDGFIIIDAEAAGRDRSGGGGAAAAAPGPGHMIYKIDGRTAMVTATIPVVLSESPSRAAAMDGKLAISTPSGTIVFTAPGAPEGR